MVSGLTPPSKRRDDDKVKAEVAEIQEIIRHGSGSTGISSISGGNMVGDTSPYTAPIIGSFSVNPTPHIQSYQIMFTEPKNASNVNPPFAPTNTKRIESGNIIKSSSTTWEGELLWIIDNKVNDDPNTKIGIFQPHNQANLTFTDSAQTFTMIDNTGTTVSGWTATYVTGSVNQYLDKVLPLRSSSCIVSDLNGGSAVIKNIIGGSSNGQLITLKASKGTTLTLETGGNIEISSDVTINDDEFALLQLFDNGLVNVAISGGGGSGARAIADVVNTPTALGTINMGDGGKDGITVTSRGKGYTSTPTVTITAPIGSNATATATVSGGKVTDILTTNGGSGYPTIGRFFLVKGGSGGGNNTVKSPCKIASTGNLSTSGIYNVQDGVTLAQGNRVLYKDQTTASENGIYVCTGVSGIVANVSRATDMSAGSTIEGGTMVYVTDGTVNGDNLFGLTTEGTITVGTGNQAWANLTVGGANQTLSNLTSPTSVNQSLIPDGDEVEDLGSTSNVWRRLYAKDIYSTGNIRTEATDDELEFYTGGGKRLGLSVSASSPFNGVAELFGASANFKTMATTVGSANAEIGGLVFDGYDSAVARQSFASVVGISENVSSGVEDGKLKFKVKRAGTTKEMLEINTIGIRLPTASLANPSDNGTIFLSGSDVKIRSGGNNVNISTIGTDILPLSNTFTGSVNTFTNATGTFQASTPIVNLGTGSGNINILGTANLTGTLDMNDNMITDITLAGIVDTGSTSRGSISGDSTKGLVINGALTTMVDVTTDIATFAKHNSGDIDFYADLDMHTYDITSLDRLKFSTTQGSGTALGTSDTGIEATYSGGSSYGMKLVVPINNIYQMFIGTSEKVTITTSAIVLNNPVSIGGYLSIGDNYMEYGDTTSTLVGTTPANKRRVFSNSQNNDELSVKKSDGSVVSLESGGASLTGNNIFTGINQFNNTNTFNALASNVNFGNGGTGSIINVNGQLALANINANPNSVGRFARNGTDVKVYTGGSVKNLSDIGTGATLSGNNTFTGINQFTNASTFNVFASNINLGSGTGIVNVIGKLSLSNIGAPTSVGQFTRDGNDVKVYTGGVVKNLTDIGTGSGASLTANQTFTGSNTFSGTTTQISGTAFNATVPSVSLGTSGGSISFVTQASCRNLVPSIDDTYDLGASGLEWNDIYIDGTAYLDSIAFGSQSMTLPTNNGTNGQVLTTNGSSSLSWTTPSSGSSGANTTLSNLSGGGTSINADMIPDISGARNLGGSTKYWGSGFISNSLYFGSGTSKKIQSSATNDLTITVPSGGDIKFQEGTTNFFVCDGGANKTIFSRDINMNSNDLVFSSGGRVDFANDTGTPTGAGGYVRVKIGGVNKWIPYFS